MLRIHVKSQHELAEFIQALMARGLDGLSVSARGGRRAKDHSFFVGNAIAIGGRVDLQERGSCVHLHVWYGHHLPDFPGKWSHDLHFHFHGLEHSQTVADGNRVAGLDGNGNHYCGCWRVYHAPVISINPVRNAVDLYQVTESMDHGDNTKTTPEDGEPTLKLTQAIDLCFDP
jgi:hypothetical protein